jgi:hypothetical protein
VTRPRLRDRRDRRRLIADAAGTVFAIWGVAAIAAASGVVLIRMQE